MTTYLNIKFSALFKSEVKKERAIKKFNVSDNSQGSKSNSRSLKDSY